MIDGEKTVLPIVTFDATHGWNDVLRLAQPFLDPNGLARLTAALDLKCVALEHHYIDKDYRDTFSNFHSKRFNTPNSRCLRLHFFRESITRDSLRDAAKVQGQYLGYAVIRPTKPNCIGRTLLTPKARNSATGTISRCKETISLHGTELTVDGFPFISQDADVTVCAQSALWMLLRYFSNSYAPYPEVYPFQVGNLTKDYSIGRIVPSSGLYVWQMAEALRRLGFAPLIYTRNNYPDDFEHLLYTYVESGLPVLTGLDRHVVVAFGHKSEYLSPPIGPQPGQPFALSSAFNQALVINDDNHFPYQLLARSKPSAGTSPGTGYSSYQFSDIVDFVVPLAEKIFLPAEDFQKVVTIILSGKEVGYQTLSPILAGKPLLLRLFLTTSKSFKRKLTERGMGNPEVEEMYRGLPLPHFIWVCEISHYDLFLKHRIWGEILWDATRNAYEPNGWIAVHYPEILVVDVGSAMNSAQNLVKIDLKNSDDYPVYRSNLKEIT